MVQRRITVGILPRPKKREEAPAVPVEGQKAAEEKKATRVVKTIESMRFGRAGQLTGNVAAKLPLGVAGQVGQPGKAPLMTFRFK